MNVLLAGCVVVAIGLNRFANVVVEVALAISKRELGSPLPERVDAELQGLRDMQVGQDVDFIGVHDVWVYGLQDREFVNWLLPIGHARELKLYQSEVTSLVVFRILGCQSIGDELWNDSAGFVFCPVTIYHIDEAVFVGDVNLVRQAAFPVVVFHMLCVG